MPFEAEPAFGSVVYLPDEIARNPDCWPESVLIGKLQLSAADDVEAPGDGEPRFAAVVVPPHAVRMMPTNAPMKTVFFISLRVQVLRPLGERRLAD